MVVLLLLASLSVDSQVAPPVFYAPNEELRGYLLEAGEKHPGLRQMHAEWLAALERVPQATSLDDPMLEFGYWLQSDDSRYRVMLSQMFPWFGTLKTRAAQATAEAEAALTRLYAERNRIFAAVKKAYFDYAYLGESIKTTETQADILTYMEGVEQSRYGLGLSSEADLLRVQTEQTKLQDRYDGYLQYRSALSAQLGAAIGREGGDVLPWPQPMELPPPPPPAPVVLARLRVSNPELGEADHIIESREHGIALAKKAGFPNFTLGLEYVDMKDMTQPNPYGPLVDVAGVADGISLRPQPLDLPALPGANASFLERIQGASNFARSLRDQTTPDVVGNLMGLNTLAKAENEWDNETVKDEVMVTVGMNLPIWRKRVRAGIREAQYMKEAAEHDKHRRALSLDASARSAMFGMEDGMRRVRVLNDSLIPQAKRTYETLQSTYATGEMSASFLDVLSSVQTLLDFELEMVGAKRDLLSAAAELELILGGPWADKGVPAPDPVTLPTLGEDSKNKSDTSGETGVSDTSSPES
ncbi:MAG: TolC family protein [Candidatus Hydrogenedentes bacterium]|nr:TolC family protein [Candidatus Hydrogenedentota bacterium]